MLKPKQATVRSATSADTAAICAIYNEAISLRGSTFETEHRGTADFDERIAVERLPFLVADVDGTVTGWAALAPYSSRPCYAGIGEASVYVASDARGRGVGTALAETLATEAERRNFYKLLGKLFTDNIASIRLVGRCGFSSVGIHRRHGQLDGEWRDVLVVERPLGARGPESTLPIVAD